VTEVRDDDVLLRLEGVTKVYSGTVTVKQADFDVRRGAVNVLVGENGAGKSTLNENHRRRRIADRRAYPPRR
jgi:erythritol transport system ATP-binding protein